MNPARKIVCVTGTRADYPRVKAVLFEIERRQQLELELIVTGMHLLKEYGYTVNEIEKDGFDIAERVEMFTEDDTPYGMAKAAARCSDGMADALRRIRPDLVLLTVDRVETLATAQTAALMNYPIAHIQGGEVTGTIDESIRHAVSKMSHIHLVATSDAAERLIKMGEDPDHVFTVGCPYIDIISTAAHSDKAELARKYGFDPERPLVLLTQHPVTTEYGSSVGHYEATLEALERFGDVEVMAIYSNADAGGRAILKRIKRIKHIYSYPSIDSEDFLSLMNYADVMLGNSSVAIREAPSFKLAAVNVGTRQQGRLRAANVIDVPPDADAITAGIDKALHDEAFKNVLKTVVNPYGDGRSAKRIVDILESVELTPELIQKRITY